MQGDLERLLAADTSQAVQIGERVWWVGADIPDDAFQCHVYFIEQGSDSVLIDPGSMLTIDETLRKIASITPLANIRYVICQHQDPDITASLPVIRERCPRPDLELVAHWRGHALLKHYGLDFVRRDVDLAGGGLELEDRELTFIPTPYLHSPAAFCTLLVPNKLLFSSDLFGAYTPEHKLVAEGDDYFELMRPFHEHYMPSREILSVNLERLESFDFDLIAPQHGSLIPGALIPRIFQRLKALDCGAYLFDEDASRSLRRSKVDATLAETVRAISVNTDFRSIVQELVRATQELAVVEGLSFLAPLGDELFELLQLARYRAASVKDSPLTEYLEGTRSSWAQIHRGEFLCLPSEEEGQVIDLLFPLFDTEQESLCGLAICHVDYKVPRDDLTALVATLSVPLAAALEREIMLVKLQQERRLFYERSTRDALTGLHNRFYLEEMIPRLLAADDRANARLGLAIFDIDHFKRINDEHGHQAGDIVLNEIGQVLSRLSRLADLVVRFGGEEFIVIHTSIGMKQVAEGLRLAVECMISSIGIPVTISCGYAVRSQSESWDRLLQRADQALYEAKAHGRNQVRLSTG